MGEAKRRKLAEQAIAAAKTPEGLALEHENYARKWSENDAAAFERDGHYTWMASHVGGSHRVLEIGTGDGRGTIELLRADHIVVSIDENPACLSRAEKRISDAGFSAMNILRGTTNRRINGYAVKYEPIALTKATTKALLIEGDTLNDPNLLSWLRAQPPFDAVTCWLTGSHNVRQYNIALPQESEDRYRVRVQNGLYELADLILGRGGILNIVDRGMIGTTPATIKHLNSEWIQNHKAQALPTSLQIDLTTQTRPYDPPTGEIKMGVTPNSSGRVLEDTRPGLISTVARKQ